MTGNHNIDKKVFYDIGLEDAKLTLTVPEWVFSAADRVSMLFGKLNANLDITIRGRQLDNNAALVKGTDNWAYFHKGHLVDLDMSIETRDDADIVYAHASADAHLKAIAVFEGRTFTYEGVTTITLWNETTPSLHPTQPQRAEQKRDLVLGNHEVIFNPGGPAQYPHQMEELIRVDVTPIATDATPLGDNWRMTGIAVDSGVVIRWAYDNKEVSTLSKASIQLWRHTQFQGLHDKKIGIIAEEVPLWHKSYSWNLPKSLKGHNDYYVVVVTKDGKAYGMSSIFTVLSNCFGKPKHGQPQQPQGSSCLPDPNSWVGCQSDDC